MYMDIDKGTFGSEEEFKVLFILNKEANTDKRIRTILTSFNYNLKDISDSNLKNKDLIYKLFLSDYSRRVDEKHFENGISTRLKNYFNGKIRKAKKQ